MIKHLVKIQLKGLLVGTFKSASRNKKERKKRVLTPGLIAFLAVYVVASLLFSLGAIFYGIFSVTASFSSPSLYFSIVGFFIFLLCLIGSIFTVQPWLFEAKDNDLLLSLPIPPRVILLSRFLSLAIVEYTLTLFVAAPAAVVYHLHGTPTASQAVLFLFSLLLLPLFSLSLACLLGWLLSLITAKMRHKTLFQTVLVLAFLIGYLYVVSNADSILTALISSGAAEKLFSYLPPVYLFGEAIFSADLVSFAYLALWCILPISAVLWFFSRFFIRIATKKRGLKKIKYVEKVAKISSPRAALTKKELRRIFSLPSYLINSAMGVFMEAVLCGYLIISGGDIQTMLSSLVGAGVVTGEISPYISLVIAAILSLCAATSVTTACAISLEGTRLPLLKSFPLSARDVFTAKICANLIVASPTLLVASTVCAVLFPLTVTETLLIYIVPLCALFCFVCLGLAVNVRFPKLDWLNEIAAIKQGLAPLVSMLGGMFLTVLPIVLYFVLIPSFSPTVFLLCYLVFFLLVSALSVLYLVRGGEKRFYSL